MSGSSTGARALLAPRCLRSSGSGAPADLRPRPGRPPSSFNQLERSASTPATWCIEPYAMVLLEGPSEWAGYNFLYVVDHVAH